jgi:hypothetical protein
MYYRLAHRMKTEGVEEEEEVRAHCQIHQEIAGSAAIRL